MILNNSDGLEKRAVFVQPLKKKGQKKVEFIEDNINQNSRCKKHYASGGNWKSPACRAIDHTLSQVLPKQSNCTSRYLAGKPAPREYLLYDTRSPIRTAVAKHQVPLLFVAHKPLSEADATISLCRSSSCGNSNNDSGAPEPQRALPNHANTPRR